MQKIAAFAFALAGMVAAGSVHAADDALLKRLVGDWEGIGTFRWDAGSDPERVFCKINATQLPDGGIKQTGRCALTTDSAALTIEIKAAAAGSYTGTATSGLGLGLVSRKPATFSGTGKGNTIVLTAPPAEGQPGPTVTTIDLIAGGFKIRADRIDGTTGKKFVGAEITFGKPS